KTSSGSFSSGRSGKISSGGRSSSASFSVRSSSGRSISETWGPRVISFPAAQKRKMSPITMTELQIITRGSIAPPLMKGNLSYLRARSQSIAQFPSPLSAPTACACKNFELIRPAPAGKLGLVKNPPWLEIFIVGMLGIAGGVHYAAHVRAPWPPGVRVREEPRQQKVEQPKSWTMKGYEITPLAAYQIRARVLHTEAYHFDRESDLSPVDWALGWRSMSDSAALKRLRISQGGRWYF